MRKQDVKLVFGTYKAVSQALGISQQAVSLWGDVIPRWAAQELAKIYPDKLTYDPGEYHKGRPNTKKWRTYAG